MEHDASSVRSLNNISHYNLRGAGSEGRGNNNNNNINLHNNSSSSSSNPAGTLNASHMEFTTLKTELIDVSSEDLAGYNGRAGSGGDLSVPSSPVDMLRVSTIKSPLKSPLKSPRTLAALEGQDHLHTKSKLFPATATPAGNANACISCIYI